MSNLKPVQDKAIKAAALALTEDEGRQMGDTPLSRLQACASAAHYGIPKRSDLQWVLTDHEKLNTSAILAEAKLSYLYLDRDELRAEIADLTADRARAVQAADHFREQAKRQEATLLDAEQNINTRPTWLQLWFAFGALPFAACAGWLAPALIHHG